jgi:hypothetical protein
VEVRCEWRRRVPVRADRADRGYRLRLAGYALTSTPAPYWNPIMRTMLAAALLSSVVCTQQRPAVDLSVKAQAHQTVQISPDGQFVAYRTAQKLALVDILGAQERIVATGTNLDSFLWSPTSQKLFFVDGNDVLSVGRFGGTPLRIATFVNQTVWIWDTDSPGTALVGTHYDPATRVYHLFTVDTSGTKTPVDLITSQDTLREAAVDPSDQFIVYRQQGTQPFDPVSFWRIDANGANPIDLAGGSVGIVATSPHWVDNGDTIVFSGLDAGGQPQVMRLSRTTQLLEPLTARSIHQKVGVSADGSWIIFEAVDGVGGNGPAIMPTTGGGLVYLFTGQGYQYSGPPTIDDSSTHAVWGGARFGQPEAPKPWRVDLDDEMRVHPRAEIGRIVRFDLPAAANEFGVIFLGIRSPGVNLPNVSWDFNMGPGFLILIIGQGGVSPVSIALPLPNMPVLRGLRVDFQGLRWDPVAQVGEFTRWGALSIF